MIDEMSAFEGDKTYSTVYLVRVVPQLPQQIQIVDLYV